MANVKWIKIVIDIFDDEKMLLIESMPGSDGMMVIWLKLLCLAGKINNGGVLLLNDRIAYTEEMLATIFRRDVSTVRMALKTFEELEMIVLVNKTITIPNWGKHQSLDRLEKITLYQRIYMREKRAKQKELASRKSEKEVNKNSKAKKKAKTGEKITCEVHSEPNSETNVRSLEGELDLELDLDKEIYRDIVSYLNEKTGKGYKYTSKATRNLIDARVKEGFKLEDFKKVIDTKAGSWKNDKKMSQYLRPNTLFGTKFESYLNEKTDTENTEDYGW